jgi:hypothetical protein
MTHNTLYERFVDQGDNEVQGYIAYGLYKNAKREWVIGFKAANNRDPTPDEVASYVSAYTEQTIATFETQAAGVLAAFAEGAVADAQPGIVEDALRGSFWASVWQSITANTLYTLILLALVLVLAFAGVDVLGVYEKISGK